MKDHDKKFALSFLLLPLTLCLLLITCCEGGFGKEKQNGYYSNGLVPEKTGLLTFDIADETRDFSLNIRHFETADGRELVLHLNELNNSIGIYDLEQSKKIRHVYYEVNGPNGVGTIDGFDLINLDSVFLLARYEYKVSMVKISKDSDTVLLYNTFKMRDFNTGLELTPFASIRAPIVVRNDSIILAAAPYIHHDRTNMYRSGKNLVMINMKDRQFGYHNLHTPNYDDSWTLHYTRSSYTFEPEKELLVFSLPIDDSIITIDKYGNRSSYLVKSAIAQKPRPFRGNYKNDEQVTKHYLTQFNYGYILYDSYRQYYYRFTETTAKNVIEKYGTKFLAKNIGLMVLDKNFQVLGETEYLNIGPYPIYFIGKKGLYRFIGSDDESEMTFELYEFPGS